MDEGPRPVTLLICDDHRVLTDALAIVVGLDAGLELVAPPVQDPQSAIALCAEFLPDVVLMDVDLKSDDVGDRRDPGDQGELPRHEGHHHDRAR